jgi:protease I
LEVNVANVLIIIPPERFRDEELFCTKEELEDAGNDIVIASTKTGMILGSRGGKAKVKLLLSDIDTSQYEAVVFVGGGGSKLLFENPEALKIAKNMYKDKKVVSAICLASVILANAGVLKGKKATVSGTESVTIETRGAKYTGPGVTVDGLVVTANGPKASRLFGQKIAELLE